MACNIDNRFYIRNLEKKGNYNLSSKRTNSWYKYSKKTRNRNSDIIKINTIRIEKMSKQARIKHIKNKIYFNCGKIDYIAKSCRNDKGQYRESNGKMQIAVIKREAYEITGLDKGPAIQKPVRGQDTHSKYQGQMRLYVIQQESPEELL